MSTPRLHAGSLIREWRQRRHLSQLDLACEADISTRHLSCVETGRAAPSREMLIHLAERLHVPLRERNRLLAAGGYAPLYRESAGPPGAYDATRAAMDALLKAHEPFPALVVDRHWTLVAYNASVTTLMGLVADPRQLEPPVNVLRLSLHPDGMARRIVNLAAWRTHVFARLREQIDVSADATLQALLEELKSLPGGEGHAPPDASDSRAGLVVGLQLDMPQGRWSFLSTTTVFGTPVDITSAELALETFVPADEDTRRALLQLKT